MMMIKGGPGKEVENVTGPVWHPIEFAPAEFETLNSLLTFRFVFAFTFNGLN